MEPILIHITLGELLEDFHALRWLLDRETDPRLALELATPRQAALGAIKEHERKVREQWALHLKGVLELQAAEASEAEIEKALSDFALAVESMLADQVTLPIKPMTIELFEELEGGQITVSPAVIDSLRRLGVLVE